MFFENNSINYIFSNVSALKGAFLKKPTWLNIQVGFIIDPFQTKNMKVQTWKLNCHSVHIGKLKVHAKPQAILFDLGNNVPILVSFKVT